MSIIMNGTDVAKSMKEELAERVTRLKNRGVNPCLAIVRVGARPDDLSYERGATKRMELTGIGCKVYAFPENISQEELELKFKEINVNPEIHGILLFRPLPKTLNEEPLKEMIDPVKDVDCMSLVNFGKIFCGDETGYAPCTTEAVMEMLDYNQIDLNGKNVTIVGRSMVVGKPLAILMLQKHATVTVTHSHTTNLAGTCRNAEILVAAVGHARMITESMVREGAVVVDVGINVDEQGNLCGDVDFEEVK